MGSYEFLVNNLWVIPFSFFISGIITYLWYAYMEYKWPFHKSKRRW